MAIVQDILAWIHSLLGGDKTISLIEKHLAALEDRRQGYEDRRKEMEGDVSAKTVTKQELDVALTELVEQGKSETPEATRLGHDYDALEEALTDLQARVGNRRSLERLLRRVISAGEELRDLLPQQRDLASVLEESLADLVKKAKVEDAEELGRLLSFLEQKVLDLGGTLVADRPAEQVKAPNSLRKKQEQQEERNRMELDDADAGLEVVSDESSEKPNSDISENA